MNKFYLVRALHPNQRFFWIGEKSPWVHSITDAKKFQGKMQAIIAAQDAALEFKDVEVNQFERTIVWNSI